MERTCDIDGCTDPHLAKGLCQAHYHRARKTRRKQQPCSLDGCNRPLHQAELCHSHYWRQYTHGDPYAGRTPVGEALAWLRATVERCLRDGVEDCAPTPYGTDSAGYGMVTLGGKHLRMHAAVLVLTGQRPPARGEGDTRHLCGNHRCVNPLHIRIGTRSENLNDRSSHAAGLTWKHLA